jgi:hypothetical protein
MREKRRAEGEKTGGGMKFFEEGYAGAYRGFGGFGGERHPIKAPGAGGRGWGKEAAGGGKTMKEEGKSERLWHGCSLETWHL